MAQTTTIPVANLQLDTENPRLSTPNSGQRETLRELASLQGTKLRVLAEDIVKHGLDPSELTIVAKLKRTDNRYVVLDGNRRLSAIKVLENPESVDGAIGASLLKTMRRLSERYQQDPIANIDCVVVKDREDARHWLELRHTGEQQGAGRVLWGSQESARFRAQDADPEPHIQALDFLESRGDLSQKQRRKIPSTTYRRLLGTPYVRQRLGVELEKGILKALADEDAVAKALMHVANDISQGNIKVRDVYTVSQRERYADELPQSVVAQLTRDSGAGVALGEGATAPAAKPRRKPSQAPKKRDNLIPSDCLLSVSDPRTQDIERELRHLSLESNPNAVSVLLRVFLELSVDWLISNVSLTVDRRARLRIKLSATADYLVKQKSLTKQEAEPVKRAAQKGTFLGPSVTQMNEWIHNPHMFPGPSDLRSEWDGLQPWFMAVWSGP